MPILLKAMLKINVRTAICANSVSLRGSGSHGEGFESAF